MVFNRTEVALKTASFSSIPKSFIHDEVEWQSGYSVNAAQIENMQIFVPRGVGESHGGRSQDPSWING